MTISKNGLAAIAACMLASTPAIAQEEETPNADGSLSGAVISAASGAGIEGALLTFSGGPEPRYASSDEGAGCGGLPAGFVQDFRSFVRLRVPAGPGLRSSRIEQNCDPAEQGSARLHVKEEM